MRNRPEEIDMLAPSDRPSVVRSDHWLLFLIHNAMRTDTVRLAHAVAALDPDDHETAARLSDWFTAFRGAIEAHHHAEDDVFFPALAAAAGAAFVDHEVLDTDHHRLDDLLTDIAGELELLAATDPHRSSVHARLVTDVIGLRHLLGAHLALEETSVLSLMDEHFDAQDDARLHREAQRAHSWRELRFLAPWLAAHANDRERALLEAQSNVVVRLFERLVRRGYVRLDAVLPPLR